MRTLLFTLHPLVACERVGKGYVVPLQAEHRDLSPRRANPPFRLDMLHLFMAVTAAHTASQHSACTLIYGWKLLRPCRRVQCCCYTYIIVHARTGCCVVPFIVYAEMEGGRATRVIGEQKYI